MLIAVAAADAKFRGQLVELLSGQGHRALTAASPAEALELARTARPQLLVVACGDARHAADFLKSIRAEPALRALLVLCVDPKSGSSEAVTLLDAGADDAITRPFQAPVFLARVRTLLRRAVWAGQAPEESVTVLNGGPVELKLVSRQALVANRPIELTRLEFELLAQLLRNPDRAFKREELLSAVWNYPGNVETRTLDKHVESLRRKLGSAGSLVQTVHGVGYRFAPPSSPAR
ncbi:MAG: response regulator transcription factor [Elusimicrobiota bacterium]|nr:response regulator transcription factor [Elusimicrobiota bacterium]